MSYEIKDVLPVVHMPYTDDQAIDYAVLESEVDYLFETGAHGFCLALVSDLLRLTAAERLALPARLVEFACGARPGHYRRWSRGHGPSPALRPCG